MREGDAFGFVSTTCIFILFYVYFSMQPVVFGWKLKVFDAKVWNSSCTKWNKLQTVLSIFVERAQAYAYLVRQLRLWFINIVYIIISASGLESVISSSVIVEFALRIHLNSINTLSQHSNGNKMTNVSPYYDLHGIVGLLHRIFIIIYYCSKKNSVFITITQYRRPILFDFKIFPIINISAACGT